MRNGRPSDPPPPTRTPPDLVDSVKQRLEADVPGLSTIFTDAAMYEQIIKECPDYFRAGVLSPDAERKLSELYGKNLQDKQKPCKYMCPVSGFSHLVGKDLDPRERAVSDRLAKLAVSNWMPGGDGILSEEPESDEAESETSSLESTSDETSTSSDGSGVDEASVAGRMDAMERLEPDNIVQLLSEEFGSLAEGGEEKLLLEADGAVFRDVIILGVIHLTTHRLTFHASLASAQPNAASRVIKAGPITVHPRGIRRKRRVWLELSSDMLSTYASARDEDRIRPLRSILLSSLKEVKPMESKHPKHMHIVFDSLSEVTEATVEFDTEESAREWRRELQGALYLYRRNRVAILRSRRRSADSDSASIDSDNVDEDEDTVRIHIPLYRIQRTERVDCMSFASFLNLVVCTACTHPMSPSASADAEAFEADVEGPPIPAPNEDEPPADASTLEHPPDLQTLQLALMQSMPAWERVEEYIAEAKLRVGDVEGYEERWAGAKVSVELEPQAIEPDSSSEETLAEQPDSRENGDRGTQDQGEHRGWASSMVPSSLSPTSLIPSSLVPSSLVPSSLVPSSVVPTRKKDGAKGKKSNAQYEKIEKKICTALALDPAQVIWVGKATAITRIFANFTGYIAITKDHFGFWSKSCSFGQDIKYRLPNDLISSVKTYTSHRSIGDHGISVAVRGQQDLRFAFRRHIDRDEAVTRINMLIQSAHQRPTDLVGSPLGTPTGTATPTTTTPGPKRASTLSTSTGAATPTPTSTDGARAATMPARTASMMLSKPVGRSASLPYVLKSFMPKAINVPADRTYLNMPSLHFVCLTIGSRGDVQPYIALGLGLMEQGHTVTIVTHEEYKEWVEHFGIGHRTAGGDPGALMKLSVENKMFTPQFFKEGISHFRSWFDDLLLDAWKQTQDADVLLESPSAMAGVHIAEALRIPYFRTFTMPWSKTHDFPHAFLSPPVESPTFNVASYVLFDNVMWTATSGQINRWRKSVLQIGATDMGHLAQSKIPYIYNFSPAVVPRPLDWGDATTISGYWFLDNPDQGWKAPQSLLDWMDKARKDQKPIVYIGFGSIVVPNPNRVTKNIIQAVLKSGVRAIISKGWSSRMAKASDEESVTFPEEAYSLDKVPHDWLFPQIDAVLHHGGAGTTGASLRAGLPTLIRPWFGDQYFWASRVQKLGAGLKISSLRVNELSEALTKATTDRIMKEKAAVVGERIRQENGVEKAIQAIYTYMPRAARDRTTID